MKKLTNTIKRIKWENLATIAMIAFSTFAMWKHIELNGLYTGLIAEIVIYGVACIGVRYIVKDIRVNKENWLLDI